MNRTFRLHDSRGNSPALGRGTCHEKSGQPVEAPASIPLLLAYSMLLYSP